ncbi:3'-5' exonuclease [candidate division KSB1 bacterium]|nr:3'-5' exonuclease [candidate division KSB1 bacterium]
MKKNVNFGEQKSLLFEEQSNTQTGETLLLGNLVLQRPMVFFDLETTGLDQDIDRIVQFAFLKVFPDKHHEEWTELVNPGIPIPREASSVHNITDEMVRDKPGFSHYAPKIKAYLDSCDLSGFNIARFDVPFLQSEMTRHGQPLDLNNMKIVDAQTIFHKKEPRTLSAAYRFYCDGEHEDAHDAMSDVRVTLEVLSAQLYKYPDLPKNVDKLGSFSTTLDDRWVTSDRKFYWRHSEAVISFGKHKGKTIQWIVENDIDYLKWMENGVFADDTKEMVREALQGRFPQKQEDFEEEDD